MSHARILSELSGAQDNQPRALPATGSTNFNNNLKIILGLLLIQAAKAQMPESDHPISMKDFIILMAGMALIAVPPMVCVLIACYCCPRETYAAPPIDLEKASPATESTPLKASNNDPVVGTADVIRPRRV